MLIDKKFGIRRIRRVLLNFLMNLNLMFLYVSRVLPPKIIYKPLIKIQDIIPCFTYLEKS